MLPDKEIWENAPGNEDRHYFGQIQPIEFIADQGLGFFEGNIVKYVARHRKKGGILDLKKAKWYLDRLIELENAKNKNKDST